jgi:hypothetical protein
MAGRQRELRHDTAGDTVNERPSIGAGNSLAARHDSPRRLPCGVSILRARNH